MNNEPTPSNKTVYLPLFPENQQSGGNALITQQNNRALLLRLIKEHKVISRVELARITGLKKATITININEFLSVGLVQNAGYIESDAGRKIKGICIAPNQFYVVSVRITPEFFALALFDINSDCLLLKKCNLEPNASAQAIFELIKKEIKELSVLTNGGKIIAIGIGYDGLLSLEDWPCQGGLSGLDAALHEAFGLPVLINNSQFFSSYRWRYSSNYNMGFHILIHIHVGKIIFSSLQANPHTLVTGCQGYAGNIGSIIVERGPDGSKKSLNDILSSDAILQEVRRRMDEYPESVLAMHQDITIQEVINAYNINDRLAREVYNNALRVLGRQLSALINIINPGCIVINGDVPLHEDVLEILKEEASKDIYPKSTVEIVFYSDAKSRQTQGDAVLSAISMHITYQAFKNIQIV